MISIVLSLAAFAADTQRYPLSAEVTLPPQGIVRIDVPLELRSPDDPDDASDLLLVDGQGNVVPVVRLETSSEVDTITPGPEFVVRATNDPDRLDLSVRNRPVDALTIRPQSSPAAARITVDRDLDGQWVRVGGPTLVWRIEAGEQTEVPLTEAVTGNLRVTIEWVTSAPHFDVEVAALRHPLPRVPEDTLVVPVAGWRLQENGFARYDVALPQAWPASRIEIHPTDPLFERQAGAITPPESSIPGEPLWWEPTPGWETVQRLHLGGADIERISVSAVYPPSDQITLLVAATDRPPLDIPEVAVVVPGAHLVVQDAGPGPHTLYGGAPMGTSPSYDLAAAAPELARIPAAVLSTGAVGPNPAYVAPEVRAALVGPSTPLSMARYHWSHDVVGPVGLVRIPLPAEVLAEARSDLGDLRLVSADGRQIPYVLRRRGADADIGALSFTRTERGKESILEMPLPVKGVPLATVAITTSAPVFHRRVTLARPMGARLETIRAYDWVGEDRPGRLTLSVGEQVVGDTLVVTIDNGDDPPLPIDQITASSPAWELWAGLPPSGADGAAAARLVYGDASATTPDYDLTLLRDQIGRRVTAVAQVGAREGLVRPPPSLADRLLTAFGVGVLGLGLLILTIRLLRGAPEPKAAAGPTEPPAPPPASQGPAEPPAPGPAEPPPTPA